MIRCDNKALLMSLVTIDLLFGNSQVQGFAARGSSKLFIPTCPQNDGSRRSHLWESIALSANHKADTDDSDLPQWRPQASPSRREALVQSWKTMLTVVVGTGAGTSMTASAQAASQARVSAWPGLEYLEPIYELQLSVTALSQALPDSSKWPNLQQRLEKFFGGGLFSERNYYAGLGVQYMNKVQYDKNELPEYVKIDKEERFQSMEAALQAMESLKTHLSAALSKDDNVDDIKTLLRSDVDQVQASLNRWFGLVPKQDVERVAQLYVSVRKADVDRNGRIDEKELATLTDDDRAIWKKRIDYIGG